MEKIEKWKLAVYKAMSGGKDYKEGVGLYWQMKNNPSKPIPLNRQNLINILGELFNNKNQ